MTTPPVQAPTPGDAQLATHALEPGLYATVAVDAGQRQDVRGRVVGATSSVLVLDEDGKRTRVPWARVASISTTTEPVHPGLT
jgi:RNase P/RNase MRP subunit p29